MNGTEIARAHRRLPRETRNLLVAACVALIALWILARLRFPDRPVSPNPISPVLTQLNAVPAFSDLASEVARVRGRLAGTVLVLPHVMGTNGSTSVRAALRIGVDTAVTLVPDTSRTDALAPEVLAADRGSGLAIVRVGAVQGAAAPIPWAPVQLDAPRFLMMTIASPSGLGWQPVFVGSLSTFRSPAWSGPVWLLPPGTEVAPAALLFTSEGELVGMAAEEAGRLAIVPGETLLADARRLLDRGQLPPGEVGIDAQAMTDLVAAATRSSGGVVVTWVDRNGPAARHVRPGDVIETMDGTPVRSRRDWEVRSRRIVAGEMVVLDVRRGGELQTVEFVAAGADSPEAPALGLALRFVNNVGSEVVSVEPGSAADRAGIVRGDIITVIGTTSEPTPAQVRLAFNATEETTPLLVAFTRGGSHHVTALAR